LRLQICHLSEAFAAYVFAVYLPDTFRASAENARRLVFLKQNVLVVDKDLQRIVAFDTECAPQFDRYDYSAERVDRSDYSGCFHFSLLLDYLLLLIIETSDAIDLLMLEIDATVDSLPLAALEKLFTAEVRSETAGFNSVELSFIISVRGLTSSKISFAFLMVVSAFASVTQR
jgi:hypothetical protein